MKFLGDVFGRIGGAAQKGFGDEPIRGFDDKAKDEYKKQYDWLKSNGVDVNDPGLLQQSAKILSDIGLGSSRSSRASPAAQP